MTIREAWRYIADTPWLCLGINDLLRRGKITLKQHKIMRDAIEKVRQQALNSETLLGYNFFALWETHSPERKKFALMAANGRASKYVWKWR